WGGDGESGTAIPRQLRWISFWVTREALGKNNLKIPVAAIYNEYDRIKPGRGVLSPIPHQLRMYLLLRS
ncbi:hypothetical protein HID58_037825, partial [Brassica napus]